MSESVTIAIDGPVASGKTAVGIFLADKMSYRFLDTGAMYRAVTWVALEDNISLNDDEALGLLASRKNTKLLSVNGEQRLFVESQDITDYLHTPEVEEAVSLVSKVPGVRSALRIQQRLIAEGGDIVMSGRDIGTVVLPKATLKIFLTASIQTRAKRRYKEKLHRGHVVDYAEILDSLKIRDKIDSERSDSPLTLAHDAKVIETGSLGIDEIVNEIIRYVEEG